MKKSILTLCTFIFFAALCCPAAYAAAGGTIDTVTVENGDPTMVTVTAGFPDNCTPEAQAIATVIGTTVIVQVFTGEPADPCQEGDLEISREFTPPVSNEYEILVLLYNGIPFDSPVELIDNETVQVVQEEGRCTTACREELGICTDNCSEILSACKTECDNNTACLDACDEDFSVCSDNCSSAFESCKEDCVLPAGLNINPDTLNLKSNGRWITAYLTPPGGYLGTDIDMESVLLDNLIKPDWYSILSGYVMIKFSREAVADYILDNYEDFPAYVELTVSGVMADDNATSFTASDTIRVIKPGRDKNGKGGGNDDGDNDDDDGGKGKGGDDDDDDDGGKGKGKDDDGGDDKGKGHGNGGKDK